MKARFGVGLAVAMVILSGTVLASDEVAAGSARFLHMKRDSLNVITYRAEFFHEQDCALIAKTMRQTEPSAAWFCASMPLTKPAF